MALGVLALTAVVPALASAETEKPVWVENGKPIKTKKAVFWRNAKIAMAAESVPGGGRMGTVCEDSGSGYVEPGGLGIIEKLTISNCQNWVGAACGAPYSLEPKGLPWHTELGLNAGKEPIDSLLGTTALNLGCYYNGGVTYDECHKVPPMRMANTTGEDVLATFEETIFNPCNFGSSFAYIPDAVGSTMKIYPAAEMKLGVS